MSLRPSVMRSSLSASSDSYGPPSSEQAEASSASFSHFGAWILIPALWPRTQQAARSRGAANHAQSSSCQPGTAEMALAKRDNFRRKQCILVWVGVAGHRSVFKVSPSDFQRHRAARRPCLKNLLHGASDRISPQAGDAQAHRRGGRQR